MRPFTADQLTFTTLANVPIGAIARLAANRDDVSLFVRCANNDAGVPLLLFLGGRRSLEYVEWQPDTLAMIVVEPADVRFSLGERDLGLSYNQFGALGITASGGYVASRSIQRQLPRLFDASQWTVRRPETLGDEFAMYPAWQIGSLDQHGDFVPATDLR